MMNNTTLYNLVGVITAPEIFSISYRPEGIKNVLHANIKDYCDLHKIECLTLSKGMKDYELLNRVKDLEPDIFIVAGWYHMISSSWMKVAPAFGLHDSLLPDYSGGAPLVWAIINGEKRTGITLFQMTKGIDNGPVIGQSATEISAEDTIATLYQRIDALGLELLREHLPHIVNGSAKRITQNEKHRRVFPQRSPEDGEIDWAMPAKKIYNFIRAQTKPYPGAFCFHKNDKITIWAGKIADSGKQYNLSQGEFKTFDQRIFVGCGGNSSLEILKLAINGVDISVKKWESIENKKN